jgi:hypothetical protein
MALKDEIKLLIGKQRKFFLMRVAEVDKSVAMHMLDIKEGTYNKWVMEVVFSALYHRLHEFTMNYKQEAIQMLRRDNQLAAVMLEEHIIRKMKEEVDSGEYNLIRTNIARDVYTRLIGDLDIATVKPADTWEQKIQILMQGGSVSIPQISPPPVQIDRVIDIPVEETAEP